MSWHLMSISDQKSMQLIMKYAVIPKQLSTGVKVLNMETFVEVRHFQWAIVLKEI